MHCRKWTIFAENGTNNSFKNIIVFTPHTPNSYKTNIFPIPQNKFDAVADYPKSMYDIFLKTY